MLQRRYVHGPDSDEPLVWYEGSTLTDRRWLHGDERGSVIAVTNGSGAMLSINKYDEFGIPQAGNMGRFGYTGQAWLPEIGMNYYKARIYSPSLGRFLQTDPIGYGDGMNMYNYVGSDPVNKVDPSGLAQICFSSIVRAGYRYTNSDGDIVVVGNLLDTVCRDSTPTSPRDGYADPPAFGRSGGRGGTSEDEGDKCRAPASTQNVQIDAVILSTPVGPAVIRGTLTDPSTGASVSFVDKGYGGITGIAGVVISGTIPGGFDALSRGLRVSGFTVGVGRGRTSGGLGAANLRNYLGATIGRVDAAAGGATLMVGPLTGTAFAYDFGLLTTSEISCQKK